MGNVNHRTIKTSEERTAIQMLMGLDKVVSAFEEDGQYFVVEKLLNPKKMGAGDRCYRLWHNGAPAAGGQWHYTRFNAIERAEYLLKVGYQARIGYLEDRVRQLEKNNYELQQVIGVSMASGIAPTAFNKMAEGHDSKYESDYEKTLMETIKGLADAGKT